MSTILIFVIAIVVLSLFRFGRDTKKQSDQIRQEGGLSKKYAELIGYLLDGHPQAKILQQTNTFVSVGVIGAAGSNIFSIIPSYGNVYIKMEIKKNPIFGNVNMDWTFPESMNQHDMFQNMSYDIEKKMKELSSKLYG